MIPQSLATALDEASTRIQALRVWLLRLASEGDVDHQLVTMAQDVDDTLRDAQAVTEETFSLSERIAVSPDSSAAAVMLTTAYLDGLLREDSFDLLSESLSRLLSDEQLDVQQMASHLAAITRLAATMAIEATGSPEEALALLQAAALSTKPRH